MSTILDALKQVEERIRNEAERKSAEGVCVVPEPSKARIEPPTPAGGAAGGEQDEVMRVYSGLVDLLSRIQDRMQSGLEEARAEARRAAAALEESVAALKGQFPRLTEAVQREFQKRDAEREAANGRVAALHAQTEALKSLFAEAGENNARLAQGMAALKGDVGGLAEAVQRELRRREAEREAGNAGLAQAQREAETAKALLAEATEANARLGLAIAGLRDDFSRQTEAVRGEFERRDASLAGERDALAAVRGEVAELRRLAAEAGEARAELARGVGALQEDFSRQVEVLRREGAQRDTAADAGSAAGADTQAEIEALKALVAETRAANAELVQAVEALKEDALRQAATARREFEQREAEYRAACGGLAGVQAQLDALQRQFAEPGVAAAGLLNGAPGGLDGGMTAPSLRDTPPAQAQASRKDGEKKGPRVSKEEALKLHCAARKAYARGGHAEALDLLDIIDGAFPGNASVLFNRAQCLIGLGRTKEARRLCDRLITELNHAPANELLSQIRD